MSGSWDAGKRVAGAAALAVERINADKTLLPGFQVEKLSVDEACTVRISYFTIPDPSKLAMAYRIVDAVTGCKVEWVEIASGIVGVQMIKNGTLVHHPQSLELFLRCHSATKSYQSSYSLGTTKR